MRRTLFHRKKYTNTASLHNFSKVRYKIIHDSKLQLAIYGYTPNKESNLYISFSDLEEIIQLEIHYSSINFIEYTLIKIQHEEPCFSLTYFCEDDIYFNKKYHRSFSNQPFLNLLQTKSNQQNSNENDVFIGYPSCGTSITVKYPVQFLHSTIRAYIEHHLEFLKRDT